MGGFDGSGAYQPHNRGRECRDHPGVSARVRHAKQPHHAGQQQHGRLVLQPDSWHVLPILRGTILRRDRPACQCLGPPCVRRHRVNGSPLSNYEVVDVYARVGMYRAYELNSPSPLGPLSDGRIVINLTSTPSSVYPPSIAALEILQLLDNQMLYATTSKDSTTIIQSIHISFDLPLCLSSMCTCNFIYDSNPFFITWCANYHLPLILTHVITI